MKNTIMKKVVCVSLVFGMQLAIGADDGQDKGVEAAEKAKFSAVEAYIDIATGKITQDDLQKKMKLEGKDFKDLLEKEMKALKSNPARLRLMDAKEFSAYVEKTLVSPVISSASGSSLIGVNADSAYVETRYFLGAGRSYVVLVRGPVKGLSAKADAYLKGKGKGKGAVAK